MHAKHAMLCNECLQFIFFLYSLVVSRDSKCIAPNNYLYFIAKLSTPSGKVSWNVPTTTQALDLTWSEKRIDVNLGVVWAGVVIGVWVFRDGQKRTRPILYYEAVASEKMLKILRLFFLNFLYHKVSWLNLAPKFGIHDLSCLQDGTMLVGSII